MATALSGRSQGLDLTVREIINADRTLSPAETEIVLSAARSAISGKTARLSYAPGGPGPDVLVGPNGRPKYIRAVSGYDGPEGHVEVVTFTEYTNRPARTCGGDALSQELVIEYEHKSVNQQWTVKARTPSLTEVLSPAFDILSGDAIVESGNRRAFDDRVGRAFIASWKPAGVPPNGSLPPGVRQSLCIDVISMLPLRWSISVPARPRRGTPPVPDYGLSFRYEPSVDLRPPDVALSNDCVP